MKSSRRWARAAWGKCIARSDTRLGRDVAIKVLPESFASDADRLRRFEQEARAIAALNHPNILAVHDIGEQGGIHYIVTELLDGRTLREQLNDGGAAGSQSHSISRGKYATGSPRRTAAGSCTATSSRKTFSARGKAA